MRAGSLSTSTRRAFFLVVVMALLCGASGMRAQGGAAAPAAAAPQADPFKVTGDDVLMIFQVDAAKTAEWESAWTEIKAKLSVLTDKPDHKALADSLDMYKVDTGSTDPAQPAIYVFHLKPPAKISYAPNKFLFEPAGVVDRKVAEDIFAKISASFKGLNVLPLKKFGS